MEKIVKIWGMAGKKAVVVLIDSRSIHSFLDEDTTKELRCPLQATLPLAITVANGSKMISKYRCKNFTWRMQGHEFTTI